MIQMNTVGVTQVYFYSGKLEKGTTYNELGYEIVDLYSGNKVVDSTKAANARGFRWLMIFNAAVDGANLVENRKYDLILKNGDDEVFRDVLIFTSQDISHETEHEFTYNHEQYKYLDRGNEVNEYKVLTR